MKIINKIFYKISVVVLILFSLPSFIMFGGNMATALLRKHVKSLKIFFNEKV